MKYFFIAILLICANNTQAQYAPQAGIAGTTAIYKDSSLFINWASTCIIKRAWQNIADTALGYASVGASNYALNKADNNVVSLGDGGEAILTFNSPIKNGTGYDFAVFENGFTFNTNLYFLELAFVEVSSDGVNYVRFAAISNSDTITQVNQLTGTDATKINNLAGKYIGNYGTPFDLDELKNIVGLDINNITHIKIIDVVGSIENKYAQQDSKGTKINDPWPTPFPSSGFDLDAVGVIYQVSKAGIQESLTSKAFDVFPNPTNTDNLLTIALHKNINNGSIKIIDAYAKTIAQSAININQLTYNFGINTPGIYFVIVQNNDENIITHKTIVVK